MSLADWRKQLWEAGCEQYKDICLSVCEILLSPGAASICPFVEEPCTWYMSELVLQRIPRWSWEVQTTTSTSALLEISYHIQLCLFPAITMVSPYPLVWTSERAIELREGLLCDLLPALRLLRVSITRFNSNNFGERKQKKKKKKR